MRALFLSLALCCLVHLATPQTEEFTLDDVGDDDIDYTIRSADTAIDINGDNDPCLSGEHIAVWESEKDYVAFIEAMTAVATATLPDGADLITGLRTIDGDAAVRTYNGKRLAPYVNFWDSPGAVVSRARTGANYFASMEFDRTQYDNFHNSKWSFVTSALADGAWYICMEAEDEDCTDDCPETRKDNRDDDDKSCFWRPYPRCLFTWKEAKDVCYKRGGHLMNLIDDDDIDEIKKWTEDDPSWLELWLGLQQLPGQGTPAWSHGQHVDEQDAWEETINYGSSSNYFPYAGIWHRDTEAMDLYQVSDGMDGTDRKAFAACEATREHYCIYNSPDVKYAEKSVCCDYDKLRYTCKAGWEFPDGTTYKEVDCSCDEDYHYSYIPDCILKNPCKYDAHLCEPHGDCIFTNQYQRPYYCLCQAGYVWNDAQNTCVDINECLKHPCGHYGGHCVNTPGSYWCTCDKDSKWDNGYCSKDKPDVVAVHTMTIYFHVNMNYDPHMNDPNHIDYEYFKEALEALTAKVYFADQIKMVDFYVSEEEFGKMKVKVVFDLYIAADITTVSKYVWKFYTYIKDADFFTVNSNTYPYYGSVYFKSPTRTTEIAISSPCSIFDAVGQCHGSYCAVEDHYTPKCHCRHGYHGKFCEEREERNNDPYKPDGLTDTEIGLIVAVCILFLLIIIMPFCVICCYQHCYFCKAPKKRVHHEHEVYTSSPYSPPTYVIKPTNVAARYPRFL